MVVLKTDVANRQWISSALLNTLSTRSIITGCSRASSRSFLRKNGESIAPSSVCRLHPVRDFATRSSCANALMIFWWLFLVLTIL